MIKVARKPSSDPLQEKLRQNKALWNKDISAFISDLINLKKTMNGWPSKFFQEKSFIKDPIPADPVTLLGVLSGDFQELAQKGNSIVQEQLDYSKTRRKKQVKAPGQPAAGTPPAPEQAASPDLSQQLEAPHTASLALDMIKVASAFEEKYGLVSEGSNPMSRFFTKLLNPTFGPFGLTEAAKVRRVRKQLLNSSATTYKKLERLQVSIVKSSKASIQQSNEIMRDAWTDWDSVRSGFKTYKGLMPATVSDSGGDIPVPQEVADIKKKEEEASKKPSENIDKKFDNVNKAIEDQKPEPDDSDYENPSEQNSPDWNGTGENIMNDLHEQEVVRLAAWAKSDFQFALRNMTIFNEFGVNFDAFNQLAEYIKNFSIRTSWASMVVQSHKETVAYINSNLGSGEKSFKDIIAVLKARKAVQEKIQKQKKQLQDTLDKAKQKALLHNVQPKPTAPANDVSIPPDTGNAQDQLEATAQAFLKKWIGKTRHQMSMFDQTSSQRLQIFDVADEARKTINDVMDHLEKDLNVKELEPIIDKVSTQMSAIRTLTRNLHMNNPAPKKGK